MWQSWLLDVVYGVVLVGLGPLVGWRRWRHGRYRRGWGERFGAAPERAGDRPCVWVHGVSLGEVNAAASLIAELERRAPGVEVVVSTTTDTGYERAVKVHGGKRAVFFWPLDFSWAVRRALRRVRPGVVVLMELEVWPNFVREAGRQGVPVVVANGRISVGKGWPRYRRVARVVRGVFGRLALVLAQDEEYAERFRVLGARRVEVAGSLKYDTAGDGEAPAGTGELVEEIGLGEGEVLWVAGSTGPGEEEMVLGAWEGLVAEGLKLRLAVVPRKPERFEEVGRLIAGRGHAVARYSELKGSGRRAAGGSVVLGDTLGDLRRFYGAAGVVFVGRSLVAMGGSDMMEAAVLGRAVVVGPYTENFGEAVGALRAAGGIVEVGDAAGLRAAVGRLVREREWAAEVGRRGQGVIRGRQGATGRSVGAILGLEEVAVRLGLEEGR